MLKVYILFSVLLSPIIDIYLLFRLVIGKENPRRIKERVGFSSKKRPSGKLIWIHCASVGESKSSLELIKKIINKYKDITVVVTSVTKTSAEIMEESLSKISSRVFHQYAPVDKYFVIRRFLKHWKPNMLLLVESEIWPNLIIQTGKKGIPIYFVNARISEKSFNRWKKYSSIKNEIFSYFTACFPQSKIDENKFKKLELKNVEFLGNLKYDGEPLVVDKAKLLKLKNQINGRQTLLVASTHKGEEQILIKVYEQLQEKFFSDLLLIIAPRHPKRLNEIIKICEEKKFKIAIRSKAEEIKNETNIYIADTLGELGLFYNIADVIFLGGSLVDVGGHNPLEAAKLGKGVITGSYVKNCTEIYEEMFKSNSSIKVITEKNILEEVKGLLNNEDKRDNLNENAYLFMKNRESASEKIFTRISLKLD